MGTYAKPGDDPQLDQMDTWDAKQTSGSNNPGSERFKTAVKNFLDPTKNIKGETKLGNERQRLRAAKKLIRQRDDKGNVVNYAENAARASNIALDASEGSTYSKLLKSRAYKKNEADQKGVSVGKMKRSYKHKDAALDAINEGKVSVSDEHELTYKQTARAAKMIDKGKTKKAKKFISRKQSKNERKLVRKTGDDFSTVSTADQQKYLNKL